MLAAGMNVVIGDVDGAACAAVAAELGGRAVGLPLDVRNAQDFEGSWTTRRTHSARWTRW